MGLCHSTGAVRSGRGDRWNTMSTCFSINALWRRNSVFIVIYMITDPWWTGRSSFDCCNGPTSHTIKGQSGQWMLIVSYTIKKDQEAPFPTMIHSPLTSLGLPATLGCEVSAAHAMDSCNISQQMQVKLGSVCRESVTTSTLERMRYKPWPYNPHQAGTGLFASWFCCRLADNLLHIVKTRWSSEALIWGISSRHCLVNWHLLYLFYQPWLLYVSPQSVYLHAVFQIICSQYKSW